MTKFFTTLKSIIPGFLGAVVLAAAKTVSKFLMVAALAAIGLNTSFSQVKKSGIDR